MQYLQYFQGDKEYFHLSNDYTTLISHSSFGADYTITNPIFSGGLWLVKVIRFNEEWQLNAGFAEESVWCCYYSARISMWTTLTICFSLLTLTMGFSEVVQHWLESKLLKGVCTCGCEQVMWLMSKLCLPWETEDRERNEHWVVMMPRDGMINMWPKTETIRAYYRPHVRVRASHAALDDRPKHTFTARRTSASRGRRHDVSWWSVTGFWCTLKSCTVGVVQFIHWLWGGLLSESHRLQLSQTAAWTSSEITMISTKWAMSKQEREKAQSPLQRSLSSK